MTEYRINGLRPGPRWRSALDVELSPRVKAVWRVIGGDILECSLEEFEDGFLRDMRPDREVVIWERIVLAWRNYLAYWKQRKPPLAHARRVIGALVSISAGNADCDSLGVSRSLAKTLIRLYSYNTPGATVGSKSRGN